MTDRVRVALPEQVDDQPLQPPTTQLYPQPL
jgi:hypothetical protein